MGHVTKLGRVSHVIKKSDQYSDTLQTSYRQVGNMFQTSLAASFA